MLLYKGMVCYYISVWYDLPTFAARPSLAPLFRLAEEGAQTTYTFLNFLLSGGLKSLILCMLFIPIFVPQIVTEGTWTSIRA